MNFGVGRGKAASRLAISKCHTWDSPWPSALCLSFSLSTEALKPKGRMSGQGGGQERYQKPERINPVL